MNPLDRLLETPLDRASDDRQAIFDRGAGQPLICSTAWLLVRTVTTGRQAGGVIPYPEELQADKGRLLRLVEVAKAGGWDDWPLLDALMDEGEATAELERIAREAGLAATRAPEMLDSFLLGEIERLVTPSIEGLSDLRGESGKDQA